MDVDCWRVAVRVHDAARAWRGSPDEVLVAVSPEDVSLDPGWPGLRVLALHLCENLVKGLAVELHPDGMELLDHPSQGGKD